MSSKEGWNLEQQMPLPTTIGDALERTLDELKESLESLPFVVVDEEAKERLELPKGIGWVEFIPLSGTQLDEFEEKRIRSRWRQQGANNMEMEIVADWAAAFQYLFRVAITDFEIKVKDDKVVRFSDFRRKDDAIAFLTKLHWKLQRYIGLYILKVSGWEPPRQL